MSILQEILRQKRVEIDAAREKRSVELLKSDANALPKPRGFVSALRSGDHPRVIAEIKRASPSKGNLNLALDPVATAKAFLANGASCLSVLTEERYFQGKNEFLTAIKAALPEAPVLRKDFIVDPYQVWETRALGADAILLIAAALDDTTFTDLFNTALSADLNVLIEVHNEEELRRALPLIRSAKQYLPRVALGVNNRDLHTFHTSLAVAISLGRILRDELQKTGFSPDELTLVAESGIHSADDLFKLSQGGIDACLIGEYLVVADDPGAKLHQLREATKKLLSDSNDLPYV